MKKVTRFVFTLAVLTISGMIAGPAFGQTAVAPYKLTVFAPCSYRAECPRLRSPCLATTSSWDTAMATCPTAPME